LNDCTIARASQNQKIEIEIEIEIEISNQLLMILARYGRVLSKPKIWHHVHRVKV
jgi:hypothetical protein